MTRFAASWGAMHRRASTLLTALVLAGVALPWPAAAQVGTREPASPLLAPDGTRPGETAEPPPRAWHRACAIERRRPVSLVLGLDDFRDYRPAQRGEARQAGALVKTLCPGDRVVLVVAGRTATLLGEPTPIRDLSDLDDLVLRIENRREPRDWRRINDALLKVAVDEWGSEANRGRKDLLRVLVFMTRDLESKAPKDASRPDFSWLSPPYWLQDHALVALFRPIATESSVEAWEIFVVTTPAGVTREQMGEGLRVDLDTWLEPARLLPEPPKPERRPAAGRRMEVPVELPQGLNLPDPRALYVEPDGLLRWDADWTPWVVVAVLAFLLVLTFGWVLVRAAPRRFAGSLEGHAPELTLVIHDRLHGKVLGRERVRLEGAVRVGASLASDVTVPGPYALEILPGAPGASPRLRSANSLPVEVERAAGGRRVRASESVAVPLRPGDRIQLGGGQEIEILMA